MQRHKKYGQLNSHDVMQMQFINHSKPNFQTKKNK